MPSPTALQRRIPYVPPPAPCSNEGQLMTLPATADTNHTALIGVTACYSSEVDDVVEQLKKTCSATAISGDLPVGWIAVPQAGGVYRPANHTLSPQQRNCTVASYAIVTAAAAKAAAEATKKLDAEGVRLGVGLGLGLPLGAVAVVFTGAYICLCHRQISNYFEDLAWSVKDWARELPRPAWPWTNRQQAAHTTDSAPRAVPPAMELRRINPMRRHWPNIRNGERRAVCPRIDAPPAAQRPER